MKQLVLTLMLWMVVVAGSAQVVISSNGDSKTVGGMEVSWTIGEVIIETFTGNTAIVTQGFHQPGLSVTAVTEVLFPEMEISLFPNPTADILSLQFSEYIEGLRYILLDVTGKVLENKQILAADVRISMSPYAKGAYILKVIDDSLQNIQTFRVIRH